MLMKRISNLSFLHVVWISFLFIVSCSNNAKVNLVSRKSVEEAHGLNLPPSAQSCQQIRMGAFFDRGILSLFEVDRSEIQQFIAQLKIKSRNSPRNTGVGNPCINGWNVWPEHSATFVPGNKQLNGLKSTWKSEATPIEMLSCGSPKGDWLHVEIWSTGDHALVKLYTDWN